MSSPSEELQHRYPNNVGTKIGVFELFQTQLTTIGQFASHGILPNLDYGEFISQKCDSLIIIREPVVHSLVIGEDKPTGGVTVKNWKKLAKDLLETKLQPTNTPIGYVSDNTNTYWINGTKKTIQLIEREDGLPMPKKIDFSDPNFLSDIQNIIQNFDSEFSLVRSPKNVNPDALAKSVWQTIWRLKADRPEDCLATFVELFIYKFLDDLGLLTRNEMGQDISVNYVLSLDREHCYKYYWETVRPFIKKTFPAGNDGLSIINGIVLQPTNRDHNLIFSEILKKFVRFGSLKNTNPEFKKRLYESFLQASDTTTTFGQFFTPRKVVAAIHDMAMVESLPSGREICDPACGVGGFVLEQMARNLNSQFRFENDELISMHNWHGYEIVPKTAILGKANALVHCGDILANQPSRVKAFANWLNQVFECKENTSLGALEEMAFNKYDLILTNPPYVVSGSADIGKLIKSNPNRKSYFAQKYNGVEGLFIQYIIQSLKPNGEAWILLPETFFLRTTDKELRDWMFSQCQIDLLALLPERTFYNTPKRVVIVHIKKRPTACSRKELISKLEKEKILLFAVSEIGETRDAKRFPIDNNDLPILIQEYKKHTIGIAPTSEIKRAVVIDSKSLFNSKTINIRHYWNKTVAQELGLLGEDENPIEAKKRLDAKIGNLNQSIRIWLDNDSARVMPPSPKLFKSVRLGDNNLFKLRIGKRVLKKEIFQSQTSIPLFSANIRKPFGYVKEPNGGNLPYGGALWSIDSDFDCKGVSSGEVYSITDHCGQVEFLIDGIEPRYFAKLVRQAGIDHGFSRDFRPSLQVFTELEIDIPVKENNEFDYELMNLWANYLDEVEKMESDLLKLIM